MTDSYQIKARIALAAALVAAALYLAHGLLPAIVWAGVVSVGLEPLRRWMLTRMPGRDTLVAAALTTLVAVVVLAPLAIGVTQAAREAGDVAAWIQHARVDGVPVPAWVGSIPVGSDHIASWWKGHLGDPVAARQQLQTLDMASLMHRSQSIGLNVLARLIALGFIVTTLFFILRDHDSIGRQVDKATRRAFGDAGPRLGSMILSSVRGTIDGVVLVGLAQGAVMGVVYYFCGVPHPVLFALLTGVGAMVPLGVALAVAVPALMLLAAGAVVPMGVMLALAFGMHFVAEHFVKPALIGGATKLPFVWVLVGLVGGIETMGLLGLFVGPAVMAAVVLIWREYAEHGNAVVEAEIHPEADGTV